MVVVVVINKVTHPLTRFFNCRKSSIAIVWKVLHGLEERRDSLHYHLIPKSRDLDIFTSSSYKYSTSDNGSPMKGITLVALCYLLDTAASYSRPRSSLLTG